MTNVIPAQPGWFIVGFLEKSGGEYVLLPIVAWRIDIDDSENCLSMADAITVELYETTGETLLLAPGGQVISPMSGRRWDTIEDCMRERTLKLVKK
jgi:hypothetical protein